MKEQHIVWCNSTWLFNRLTVSFLKHIHISWFTLLQLLITKTLSDAIIDNTSEISFITTFVISSDATSSQKSDDHKRQRKLTNNKELRAKKKKLNSKMQVTLKTMSASFLALDHQVRWMILLYFTDQEISTIIRKIYDAEVIADSLKWITAL